MDKVANQSQPEQPGQDPAEQQGTAVPTPEPERDRRGVVLPARQRVGGSGTPQ